MTAFLPRYPTPKNPTPEYLRGWRDAASYVALLGSLSPDDALGEIRARTRKTDAAQLIAEADAMEHTAPREGPDAEASEDREGSRG